MSCVVCFHETKSVSRRGSLCCQAQGKRLRCRKTCLFVLLTKFFSISICNNYISFLFFFWLWHLSSPPPVGLQAVSDFLTAPEHFHVCDCFVFAVRRHSLLLFSVSSSVSSTTQEERETAETFQKGKRSNTTPVSSDTHKENGSDTQRRRKKNSATQKEEEVTQHCSRSEANGSTTQWVRRNAAPPTMEEGEQQHDPQGKRCRDPHTPKRRRRTTITTRKEARCNQHIPTEGGGGTTQKEKNTATPPKFGNGRQYHS